MSNFHKFRKRINEILEPSSDGAKDIVSYVYDIIMIIAIFLGIVPLMFKGQSSTLILIDNISLFWFVDLHLYNSSDYVQC